MTIRESIASDLHDVLHVETLAFGLEKGPVIAKLVNDLLVDPTARPLISLLAIDNGKPVGHILFTRVAIDGAPEITGSILAPLAIVPEAQSKGIGGLLIAKGLDMLKEAGADIVFVLGHPTYYPRSGFHTVGSLGFEAPYPIPSEYADAWMVQALRPGILGAVAGKVLIADALDHPEHWVE
ncbi:N-acetyltransferase [bacterium]|nr:N-acetyltransferase [bacterium]